MLKEGDVIEIKEGHEIYADVPAHFVYSNKKGCYDLTHTDITVGGEFSFFAGNYIVTKTNTEGGGTGHGKHNVYPDGHRVYCVSVDDEKQKIDFYQSGCFTAMIKDIEPVGKAKIKDIEPVGGYKMKTPDLLQGAIRQYKHNTGKDGFVIGYDEEEVNKIVIDLQNQIIDLKACLRTCANSAQGGLDQYS